MTNKHGRPTYGYYNFQGKGEPLFTDREAIAIGRQRSGQRLSEGQKTLLRRMNLLEES